MICGRGLEAAIVGSADEAMGFSTTLGFGVENAPVEDLCRRSNSSCSLGGRRGGAGPVANAPLVVVVVNRRRECCKYRLASILDILNCVFQIRRTSSANEGISEFKGY